MDVVVLPHLVCVNAIICTHDCESSRQFRTLEQNNYIISLLLFITFSLAVALGCVVSAGACSRQHGFNCHLQSVSKRFENCQAFSPLELVGLIFKLTKNERKFTIYLMAFAFCILVCKSLRWDFQSSPTSL